MSLAQTESSATHVAKRLRSRELWVNFSGRGGGLRRKPKEKGRSFMQNTFHAHLAILGEHQVFDDRQTEARAAQLARPCLINAIESLKEPRNVFGRNTDP